MTIFAAPLKLLTYETYIAEDEINERYDIINGERIFMPGATDEHQDYQGNIYVLLRDFEKKYRQGKVRMAPRDVLISRVPLHTRQPDVYFISSERNAKNPAPNDPAPLMFAPELVVEIVSDSETETRFNAKMTDYCAVGVKECWKVLRETQTVAVLRLSSAGYVLAQTYGRGETVQSLTFPDLTAAIDTIFAE